MTSREILSAYCNSGLGFGFAWRIGGKEVRFCRLRNEFAFADSRRRMIAIMFLASVKHISAVANADYAAIRSE